MADNVNLNTMSGGDTVAADEIAGAKFQRIKIVTGVDGINEGDVSRANGMPVTTISGSNTTTLSGSQTDIKNFPTVQTVSVKSLPATTDSLSYGAYTAMTVTNLQSLASSPTAGWQSDRIDLQSSLKPLDVEIFIKLPTANTAPANDKCVYAFISPAITTDGGTTWLHADQGTTTLPTGAEGTTTIASPNNLIPLGALEYKTQNMTMQRHFSLSSILNFMPDGFSIILVNYTGAALSTGCVVAYKPIKKANA